MPENSLILTNAHGWVHRLSEFALACSGSTVLDEASRLREVYALLSDAPSPARVWNDAIGLAKEDVHLPQSRHGLRQGARRCPLTPPAP